MISIDDLVKSNIIPQGDYPALDGKFALYNLLEREAEDRTFAFSLYEFSNIFNYMLVFRSLAKMAMLPFEVKRVAADLDENNKSIVNFTFLKTDDQTKVCWQFEHDDKFMSEEFKALSLEFLEAYSDQEISNLSDEDDPYEYLVSLPESLHRKIGLTKF